MRKNVHFVEQLPSNTWMYARYDWGQELNGRAIAHDSRRIQKVDVTVLSPTFSTKVTYVYQGAVKDKVIAKRCEEVKLTGNYQRFEPGTFWNTDRGVKFAIAGASLPQCRVTINFHSPSGSKSWYWDLNSWQQNEWKTFTPQAGQLTFDPDYVDVSIAFYGTSCKKEARLAVK